MDRTDTPTVRYVALRNPMHFTSPRNERMAMSDDSKYQRRDQASARLGEKLLQGWTMLATHCPSDDCFTPLMRNKQGQMFCVGCGRFVITEEEAQKQQQEQQQQQQQRLADQEREEKLQQERARAAQVALTELQAQRERSWQQQQQQQQHSQSESSPGPSGPVKRKAEDAPASIDDDLLQTTRRQTLIALYKVEYPFRF
ncbi:hypothetical protein PINS_up008146 [Pythium insidiosum]|nr:hypothetical protein PINS_up008146 [Pythium insidiosum]